MLCYKRFIYLPGWLCVCNLGRGWPLPAPGTGTHQWPALAPAWRRRELAPAGAVPTGRLRQPTPAADAGLAPAHIQVPPAASTLVHAHCPHHDACGALASANDPHAAVSAAPVGALTAPGNLLQGEIKNQISVDCWKFEWMNLVVANCSYQHVEFFLKVKSTSFMKESIDSTGQRKYLLHKCKRWIST